MEREIAIRGEMIRLGQLLKLAGLIDAGGEAAAYLATAPVRVNGEAEARRGRKLRPGDEVRRAARRCGSWLRPAEAAAGGAARRARARRRRAARSR